jgi:hypothetical protein
VVEIRGSYTNVMGLPTQRLYPFLKNLSWFFSTLRTQKNRRFPCGFFMWLNGAKKLLMSFFKAWPWIQPCGFLRLWPLGHRLRWFQHLV